jgi:hypothetical protein
LEEPEVANRNQKTADRGQLHESKVDDFAAWAEQHGYRREPVPEKALYERLRLRPTAGGAPILFFKRERPNMFGGAPQHLSTCKDGLRLVRRWFAARRAAPATAERAQ